MLSVSSHGTKVLVAETLSFAFEKGWVEVLDIFLHIFGWLRLYQELGDSVVVGVTVGEW